MKGILIILDGIGDLPHSLLKGKTPLEAAEIPNIDFFAARGKMGYMYPVKPTFIPESDEAILSIFGNDLLSSTRGQLEARGIDELKLTRGDLALRANFATIDSLEKGNIIDRRAGRTLTTEEAELLARSVNKIKMPFEFVLKPTVQHRAVLVFRGGFSDNFAGNDATYSQGRPNEVNKVAPCKSFDDDENTRYTVNVLNEFLEKAHKVLDMHPVNQDRKERGLLPANYLLVRGPGIEPPKLKQYRKWLSIAYMPLEKGFSKLSGMKVFSFDYPRLKGLDCYANLYEGLKKACKFARRVIRWNHRNFDYAYIHLKETDVPGHDNKPIEKKSMIEYIDKTLFKFLRRFCPPRGIKVIVTGDHSTPCKLKRHSADPVPVLFYDGSELKAKHFCEKEARKGTLGRILGKDLLCKAGFVR